MMITYHREEVVNMGSLVDEESDWMFINCYFQHEVWRSAWLNIGSLNPVMMTVDQRLVQVQDKNLLPDHVESVS